MEVSVLDIKGQETGRKVALNDAVFGIEPNDHVLYLDVKQYLANQRQGTAKSKERSEMSGSTRKLGRQLNQVLCNLFWDVDHIAVAFFSDYAPLKSTDPQQGLI